MIARLLAQRFMKSAIRRGLSANKTLKLLRDAGLGYRRTIFLADFRSYLDIPAKTNLLRYVPRLYRPSKKLFTEPNVLQRHRYKYTVEIKVFKPKTGTSFTMHTNVVSDDALSRGEVEDIAFNNVLPSVEGSNFEIEGGFLSEAYHRKGDTW